MYVIVIACMAIISCNTGEDGSQPAYEVAIAPGVYAVKWANGETRADVKQGDIVAVACVDGQSIFELSKYTLSESGTL